MDNEPYVYADPENLGGNVPFPDLTDTDVADGWEETDTEWFVDTSGFGRPEERALTMEAFREELQMYVREHPDHGFGITGIGQFQAYIAAFRRTEE